VKCFILSSPESMACIAVPENLARFTNKRVLKWPKNIGKAEIISALYLSINKPVTGR
jgi:hypothetical protein